MTTTMPTTSTASPTTTQLAAIPPIGHREAMVFAAAEFTQTLTVLRELMADDWRQPTVCELWDVRAMVGHMLGMAEAQASMRQFMHDFRMANKRKGGAMIDEMTATQVRERSQLTITQVIERFASAAPRAVRARRLRGRRVGPPSRQAVHAPPHRHSRRQLAVRQRRRSH